MVQYIYEQGKLVSILEKIQDVKYIRARGKLYKFFINKGDLILKIYDGTGTNSYREYVVQKDIKNDYDVCRDELDDIYVVVATKRFNIFCLRFDGVFWHREEVSKYNKAVGIPSMPIILAFDSHIYIISSYVKTDGEKGWSIRSHIKSSNVWDSKIIDKGLGLCYNQTNCNIDKLGNIHLVYRYLDKKSIIKHTLLNSGSIQWQRPKSILNDETNKYFPIIYINKLSIIYLCWVEIEDEEIYLCCSPKDASKENYFKINITENVNDMAILLNADHVINLSYLQNKCYYDVCCKRFIGSNIQCQITGLQREDYYMSIDIRLFLDLKKELENKITTLENKLLHSPNSEMKEENRLELNQKDKQIEELANTIITTTRENNFLKKEIDNLKRELSERPKINKQKKDIHLNELGKSQLVKKILGFMKKDA